MIFCRITSHFAKLYKKELDEKQEIQACSQLPNDTKTSQSEIVNTSPTPISAPEVSSHSVKTEPAVVTTNAYTPSMLHVFIFIIVLKNQCEVFVF